MQFCRAFGFSLLEILISLLLISLILLGMDAIQWVALQKVKTVYFFQSAYNQINNAVERLRALHTDDDLPRLLSQWNAENQLLLPAGFGTIAGQFPNYQITVYWGSISHDCKNIIVGEVGCFMENIQLATH